MNVNTVTQRSRNAILVGALCCISLPAFAVFPDAESAAPFAITQQTKLLKGQVLDHKTGDPVIGANVIVKGTTNGTITDMDGYYELEAPAGATLQISYIGYKTLEISANSENLTVKLMEDSETLDEVVIVGYGVQKKESLTGSLQTLKDEN